MKRKGVLFVLSSPSGAGKSTMARKLLAAEANMGLSVSATTRPPRAGEVDGSDYYFKTDAQFAAMIEADEFIEHAQVFDHRYGTPQAPVEEALAAGRDMLFDVDWQGTRALKGKLQNDVVSIFLLPPSLEELERRLRGRGTDSEEVIERRMARATNEISHYDSYDYVFVNDDLDGCFQNVRKVVEAERLRASRRGPWLEEFVRTMERQDD
ncbi:guanylate kinase [Pacificimonas flava]|uniref:Guanylate kinase n=2 Tax=Pacificimonas TaxID=1960290 RepID=A0A219B3N9_9SPHN|nr:MULTISPECIES: guanylate kinase [Pacificimonas]MBZ6377287.1 guanylate kinase [Pacificimonas aurantium]OWV33002.1 guanylate kinase [Pacificimonas flava]